MENTNQVRTYLTYQLKQERFAIDVKYVISILEVPEITQMPNTPKYFQGIINLRGEVLPVINTRCKFGMPKIEFDNTTSIIVIENTISNKTINVGILVDSVNEVIEIHDSKVKPVPNIGTKYNEKFLDGMIQNKDSFIMIVNPENVFYNNDLLNITNTILEN